MAQTNVQAFSGDVQITSNLAVAGNSTLGGTLDVTGNSTLGGTINEDAGTMRIGGIIGGGGQTTSPSLGIGGELIAISTEPPINLSGATTNVPGHGTYIVTTTGVRGGTVHPGIITGPNPSNGRWDSSNSKLLIGGYTAHYIAVQFPYQLIVRGVRWRGVDFRSPREGHVLGTNDITSSNEDATWDTLFTYSVDGGARTNIFPIDNSTAYRKYAFIVTVHGDSRTSLLNLQFQAESFSAVNFSKTIITSVDVKGDSTIGGTLGVTSNLAVDTNTLFVDSVANRVGIGKTNPGVALDVVGATSISGDLAVGGNTGISGTLNVTGENRQGITRTFSGSITNVTENEIGQFTVSDSANNTMIKVTIHSTELNGALRSLEYIYSSRPLNNTFFISGIKKNNSNSIEPLVYRSGNSVRFGYTGAPDRYHSWKVDIMPMFTPGTFTVKNSAFGDVTGFTLVNPSGTIFFRDITVASNLAVDTNTLFVDSVANRVGIGKTTGFNAKVDIFGGTLNDEGGIWTSKKCLELSVTRGGGTSPSTYSDQGTGAILRFNHNLGNATEDNRIVTIESVSEGIRSGPTGLRFGTNGTERMRITGSGNVGIGKTNPGVALDVVGAVQIAESLTVSNVIVANNNINHSLTIDSTSSMIYNKSISFTGVAVSSYNYIGRFSVYAPPAILNIWDEGAALGSGSRYSMSKQWGQSPPIVVGIEGSAFTTYKFYWEPESTNVSELYHVWFQPNRAGNYTFYIHAKDYIFPVVPENPTYTDVIYGMVNIRDNLGAQTHTILGAPSTTGTATLQLFNEAQTTGDRLTHNAIQLFSNTSPAVGDTSNVFITMTPSVGGGGFGGYIEGWVKAGTTAGLHLGSITNGTKNLGLTIAGGNGNVGIGKTNPGVALDVDGSITASGSLQCDNLHSHGRRFITRRAFAINVTTLSLSFTLITQERAGFIRAYGMGGHATPGGGLQNPTYKVIAFSWGGGTTLHQQQMESFGNNEITLAVSSSGVLTVTRTTSGFNSYASLFVEAFYDGTINAV
jgi:hypothetical protein